MPAAMSTLIFIYLSTLLITTCSAANYPNILNFTFQTSTETINAGDFYSNEFQVQHPLNTSVANFSLTTDSSYNKVGKIIDCEMSRNGSTEHNETLTTIGYCKVKGIRLGETIITLHIKDTEDSNSTKANFRLIVLRVKGVKDTVYRVFMIALVLIATFSMGCGLDIYIMLSYLKKPFAPAVGFMSQFLLMPLIAFGLAKVTNIEKAFGFGLICIGCSPGGGGSNLWAALLGGDLNLSMTMTFVSTIAAFGLMPLWLFILGRFFLDSETIKIPFEMIFVNLIQIVVPLLLGLLFKWWKPQLAMKMHSIIKLFGVIFVIFIFTVGTWVNLYMYELMGDYPYLLPIGAALPWIGFVLGFLFALIFRQSKQKAITIALETGIQNIGVPILILLYSFPEPQGSLSAIIPVVVAIFTPIPLTLIFIGMTIYRKFIKKPSTTTIEMKMDVNSDTNIQDGDGVENASFKVSLSDIGENKSATQLQIN